MNEQSARFSEEPAVKTARVWLHAVAQDLGVSPDLFDPVIRDLLDLTRDVAHGPSRPAAPLTAFLVGLASNQQQDTPETLKERITRVRNLVQHWESDDGQA
ncbi:hypothetical protein GP475_02425 [Corynebacterium poyangense]|uniref:Uncharacterized protein n=1 Tax=Corynebacterium poyangense TaxID=2684405 RepID=A0A7H0SM44_9CORY|nr:DUF6457 domain-containing protein [Corynebacterium poyangense]MBZ8176715.1 hypothetical protein [Corynebacterium poyangense]QNQ89619.1 hypothetical protein GP475_02425 [Corynebacterium poyangense]